ncbi:MAG: hypothetical protein J6Q83_03965 [Clostridia bacterium]|nr:hypothetical protein [Clostridia bacterium]
MKKIFCLKHIFVYAILLLITLFCFGFFQNVILTKNDVERIINKYAITDTYNVAYVRDSSVLYYENQTHKDYEIINNDSVQEKLNGVILEILCVIDDRVYFAFSDYDTQDDTITIASTDIDFNDFLRHYVFYCGPQSEYFNMKSDITPFYGDRFSTCEYRDGFIYIKNNDEYYSFEIKTGVVKELKESWLIYSSTVAEDFQSIQITNNLTNEKRTLTLPLMAEMDKCAKTFYSLSQEKTTWNGEITRNFFQSHINVVDDELYIVCNIFSFSGEAFSLVYKYDFETNKVFFVSGYNIGDHCDDYYVVAAE